MPPETDEKTLRKMLTSRLSTSGKKSNNLDDVGVVANVGEIEMSKITIGDEMMNDATLKSSEKIKTPKKSRKLKK